jgi:endoglucanase
MTMHARAQQRLFIAAGGIMTTVVVAALALSAPARGALTVRSSKTTRRMLTLTSPAAGVRFSARTAPGCRRSARLVVTLDRRMPRTQRIHGSGWHSYGIATSISSGSHTLQLRAARAGAGCATIMVSQIAAIPAASPGANPFAGQTLWVDPDTSAQRQVDSWSSSRPADAAQIEKIASRPRATWFGDWTTDARGDVSQAVGSAAAAGQLPVLVAYDLPNLDCGGFSAGGAPSPDAYRGWIDGFAAGIGANRAVVVVEPDALAELDCLSSSDQQSYYALISYAVATLSSHAGVSVYIDAGNSAWQPVATIASRLERAGVAQARGFALNVSNFNTTAAETTYGRQLSAALGGKHFVIDTSRNGLGPAPDREWCNPPGRALGTPPTAGTGDPLVDAYLWIKAPGESDGTCNGGPQAGVWWPDYALGLAQRAAF